MVLRMRVPGQQHLWPTAVSCALSFPLRLLLTCGILPKGRDQAQCFHLSLPFPVGIFPHGMSLADFTDQWIKPKNAREGSSWIIVQTLPSREGIGSPETLARLPALLSKSALC